jgi:hypothetical protein
MNEAQALLMCIPATAIAITVLIWLQSIHDRIADQESLREIQEGLEQRIEMLLLWMLRHRNRSQEAAPSSEPITIEELRTMLGARWRRHAARALRWRGRLQRAGSAQLKARIDKRGQDDVRCAIRSDTPA